MPGIRDQGSDNRSQQPTQITSTGRRIPPDTATISPEDTSGRQTEPGRRAHASRHSPTPAPQASAASVTYNSSSSPLKQQTRVGSRAHANDFFMPSSSGRRSSGGRWPNRGPHQTSVLTPVSSDT
jgi:hypothetical protein